MSVDDITAADGDRRKNTYYFDRHTADYRAQFEKITEEMHAKCPVAWSETYNGHWVAAGSKEVFELVERHEKTGRVVHGQLQVAESARSCRSPERMNIDVVFDDAIGAHLELGLRIVGVPRPGLGKACDATRPQEAAELP